MDLKASMKVASAGMKVQSARMRVIAENLANAQSTGDTPGADPYRRKTISFRNEVDRRLGVETVTVDRIGHDATPLPKRYEPGHPAADADGYVLYPNVQPLIEMVDMREAQRSFEASLNAMKQARSMLQGMLELLR